MAEEEGKPSKTTRTTSSKPEKKSKSSDGGSSKKTRPTRRRSKSPKSSSRSKNKREKSPKSPKSTKTSKSKSNEKASSSKSKSVVDHTSSTTTQSAKENNPNIVTTTTSTTTNSNSNNNLDPTEAEQLQEAFKMFDINGDGKIDKHELKISLEEMGQNHTKKQILQMIHSVDRDGNGKIDFDEFIDYMKPKVSETMNESELREAFAFWDSDGNGYISRGELKSAMRKMGEWLSEKEIDNMMDKVDKNGDGKVNFKEFRVMMMSSY